MVKPISPDEATDLKKILIPDEVITIWNEMIADRWDGTQAKVIMKDVITLIVAKMGFDSRIKVCDKGWMDIEDIYRKEGWKVTFYRPCYDENYYAFYIFKKKIKFKG